MNVIDPGDRASWPSDVEKSVRSLARRCRAIHSNRKETTRSYELRLEHVDAAFEAEHEFRTLLCDRLITLFHATRLLPHEIEAIRSLGLIVLGTQDRSWRLDQVIRLYGDALGADELEQLRHAGPLDWDEGHRNARLGKLWGVTPLQTAFDDDGDGLLVFLRYWGGESFYWSKAADPQLTGIIGELTAQSVPSIVEYAVEARALDRVDELWKVFVGQLDGWQSPWHEFYVEQSIPPDRVIDILDSGSGRWPLPPRQLE